MIYCVIIALIIYAIILMKNNSRLVDELRAIETANKIRSRLEEER